MYPSSTLSARPAMLRTNSALPSADHWIGSSPAASPSSGLRLPEPSVAIRNAWSASTAATHAFERLALAGAVRRDQERVVGVDRRDPRSVGRRRAGGGHGLVGQRDRRTSRHRELPHSRRLP